MSNEYDDGYGDDPDIDEELEDALADGARIFTLADLAVAMRRGITLGFTCSYDLIRDIVDDDMERREVVARPLILRRLRDGYDRWMEFVKENFGD